jgi:hypothetical protein
MLEKWCANRHMKRQVQDVAFPSEKNEYSPMKIVVEGPKG